MWEFFLVICLFFGFLSTGLAKRKKRNEIIGFFAGFFFGILAILYYLIVGEPSVPCAFCRKKVSREALICPYCHKKLETA